MLSYDAWKTNPEPTYFAREMQRKGFIEGSFDWDESMKKEFAETVAVELLSGNEENWALLFVINKFFGGVDELKKAIEVEVTDEDEDFQEFKYQSR